MPEFVLLLILVGIVSAICTLIFLVINSVREKQREFWLKRFPKQEDEGIVSAEHLSRRPESNVWSDRMDRAFGDMIRRTGTGWTTEQALAMVALAGVVLAGVLYLWRGDSWIVGLGLLVGMGVPLAVYLFLQARWRRKLQDQLPDVLFLVARSLRAGLSLDQALENVADHGHQPFAGELKRGVEQLKLGLTVPAALRGVARRVNLADFDAFVTVVTLHRNLGGNLTMLLDKVATTTRDRNLFRGHFRAATALSRATAFCLAAGAPLIFVCYSIWQPDMVAHFAESAAGIRILIVGIILEIVGILWMCYLLRSRY